MKFYGFGWIVLLCVLLSVWFLADDAFAASISATTTFTITATVGTDSGGGPPGGGPGPTSSPTEVEFSGFAYPSSVVTVLKDAVYFGETTANILSAFNLVKSGLSAGTYLFSLSTKDLYGNQSDSVTYSVNIISAARTTIGGIVIPPTVTTDNVEVPQGDPLLIYGQAMHDSSVTIVIEGLSTTTVTSVANGLYEYTLDTTGIPLGDYVVRVKMKNSTAESPYTGGLVFTIGEETIEREECDLTGDVNYDCAVNLVDFSIAAFWYEKPLDPAFTLIEADRLNGDGVVDLVDFSLMAFYWTG